MRRVGLTRLSLLLLVLLAGLSTVSCGDDDSSTTPTTPSPATTTDTFTGTFVQLGTASHPFAVKAAGTVTVTLTSISPLATMALGTRLTTWDGTACGTNIAQNPNSRVNTTALTGTANIGNYCVQIYDSGNVSTDWTVEYTVTVSHP